MSSLVVQNRWKLRLVLPLFVVSVLSGVETAHAIEPEFAMYSDPELPRVLPIDRLDDRLLPLWREVLLRPEAEHQRRAAEAIAHAAEQGFPGMEVAQDDLHELLTTAVDSAARFAAARALIAIDARGLADDLFRASQQHDSQLRVLIEPALTNWDYEAIRETWRGRVRDPRTNLRELVLALEGLAQSQDQEVLDEIVEIVLSGDRSPGLRLQAARAAGAIADSGLESAAGKLMSLRETRTLHRLCAVALLDRHDSESARRQLLELAGDAEPTVAEQALGRLNEIDPELVIPLAEAARVNPDPKVRRHAADAYVALATPERVILLSQMLNDLHPDVRTSVADGLATLGAHPELEVSVRESAFEVLAGDNWRGQEQAALILGVLDYEPAAARMVELLRSNRTEVEVATAWGLRLLAVPELLPELLQHAQERTSERRSGEATNGLDPQLAHLFEAFGLMGYREAEPLLRTYIAKDPAMGFYSRGSAIWTLGHFHAGEPDEELAVLLMERLNDMDLYNPEASIVWRMSATSLGRMRAESQLEALRARRLIAYEHETTAYAIRWALLQIHEDENLEEVQTPPPVTRGLTDWFLVPLTSDPPPVEPPPE